MFCSNCGTQNNDAAAKCQSCGFTLQKVGAQQKFKGTMLMMNAPGAPVAPGPGAPASNTQPHPPASGAAEPPRPQQRLKGTMIGVAPPSLATPSPSGLTPPPAVHESVVPSTAPGGAPQMGMAPTEAMPAVPPSSYGAEKVNPLGGTMVASQVSAELQASIAASLANPPPSLQQKATMASPEQPMAMQAAPAPAPAQSGMTVMQILLSIFTFGIYYLVVVKKK